MKQYTPFRPTIPALEIFCESPANRGGYDRFTIEDGACEGAYDACGIAIPPNVRSIMITQAQAIRLRDWLTQWIATQTSVTQ